MFGRRHATSALLLLAMGGVSAVHLPRKNLPRPLTNLCRPAVGPQRISVAAAATAASLVLHNAAALAIDTATRAATPAIPTSVIKWGAFGVFAGTAYLTRLKREPRLHVQRTAQASLQDQAGQASNSPHTSASTTTTTSSSSQSSPLDNDALLFSDLQARMQALHDESLNNSEGAEDEADEPVDSSDTWGIGSTAVLEPPSAPKVQEPPPDFPPGFPLREASEDWEGEEEAQDSQPAVGESEEAASIASEEQIEMMKRLFGSS